LIETADVIHSEDGLVDVQVAATTECDGCDLCHSLGGDTMLLEGVVDPLGATVGDRVTIEIPEDDRLRPWLVGFGVPIAALLAGYVAGDQLGGFIGVDGDVSGAIAAVASVAAVGIALKLWGRGLFDSTRYRPVVRAIIPRIR
jgi:sigma-E factor negative regulatory protein RseC